MANRNSLIQSLRRNWFDRPYLLLTLTILFWSGNLILGRAIRDEVPPIGLSFWRWFIGFFILLRFALPDLQSDFPKIVHHWKLIMFLSALGIAAFPVFFYIGLQSTTAINGGLMQTALPLAIVLMSYLLFRDTITLRQVVGIGVAMVGAIAIIAQGSWLVLTQFSFNPGDLWILAAIAAYAAYSCLLRLRPEMHSLSFLAALFGFASLQLLPLYVWETLGGAAMRFNWVTLLTVGYVALFPSILSQLFFNRGVELVGANQAGLFMYLLPVFSSCMAMALLGERLQLFHVVGISLILLGIYLATYGK
jgi:drug/metabolite transporter (DMT)-like permease